MKMSANDDTRFNGLPVATRGVTCLGCGCLCDDIETTVDADRLLESRNACELGTRWFQQHVPHPSARVESRETPWRVAATAAASILSAARAPILCGLNRASIESQRAAVALADRSRALIDPGDSPTATARRLATQRLGNVSATLGEIKNRADVIVYWSCDPLSTHPRHWQRIVEPPGRFIPTGRSGRRVFVVGHAPNATTQQANAFIPLPAESHLDALPLLRWLTRADHSKPKIPLAANLLPLANQLRESQYAAIFIDKPPPGLSSLTAWHEQIDLLARDLNVRPAGRCVVLSLGAPANAAGLEAVLGWQTAASSCVDFASGAPRFLPGEASAHQRIANARTDALLVIADHRDDLNLPTLPPNIPLIAVAPRATTEWPEARIAIDTAIAGLNAPGTVMRGDGIALPLRPPRTSRAPDSTEVLQAILAALPSKGAPTA